MNKTIRPADNASGCYKKYWLLFLSLCLGLCYVTLAADEVDRTLQSIGIEVTTHLGDQQNFRKDDIISFLLTLERDAYITAIYVDAENNQLQILPSPVHQDNYYKAGLFIPLPPQNASYQFKVQPPYGNETLWIFASDKGDIQLNGKQLANGLVSISQAIPDIRARIKSQSVRYYDEASLSIKTSDH